MTNKELREELREEYLKDKYTPDLEEEWTGEQIAQQQFEEKQAKLK